MSNKGIAIIEIIFLTIWFYVVTHTFNKELKAGKGCITAGVSQEDDKEGGVCQKGKSEKD